MVVFSPPSCASWFPILSWLFNVRVGWLLGEATPSLYERDSRGRLPLREQKLFRPKFLDGIPQLRRLLEFKPFGRLSHIAL